MPETTKYILNYDIAGENTLILLIGSSLNIPKAKTCNQLWLIHNQ